MFPQSFLFWSLQEFADSKRIFEAANRMNHVSTRGMAALEEQAQRVRSARQGRDYQPRQHQQNLLEVRSCKGTSVEDWDATS